MHRFQSAFISSSKLLVAVKKLMWCHLNEMKRDVTCPDVTWPDLTRLDAILRFPTKGHVTSTCVQRACACYRVCMCTCVCMRIIYVGTAGWIGGGLDSEVYVLQLWKDACPCNSILHVYNFTYDVFGAPVVVQWVWVAKKEKKTNSPVRSGLIRYLTKPA